MAAYSPCIVLRGRGREGKTTVIECMGALDSTYAQKVESFHKAYEAEFYVILVASLAVLEDLPPTAYDEGILPPRSRASSAESPTEALLISEDLKT
jgi:hypothetical protein